MVEGELINKNVFKWGGRGRLFERGRLLEGEHYIESLRYSNYLLSSMY